MGGKKEVQFPVPRGIKFADVGINTGLPEAKFPGKTLRVALREEIELLRLGPNSELESDLKLETHLKSEPKVESESENTFMEEGESVNRLRDSSDISTGSLADKPPQNKE